MSLIKISDLHHQNTNLLITLNNTDVIVGGSKRGAAVAVVGPTAAGVPVAAPPSIANPFAPYSGAYSISTSNSTRSDFLATTVGANFNAAFTVNSPNPRQAVSGGLSVSVDYMGRPLIRTH